jgi:hypothetical protein
MGSFEAKKTKSKISCKRRCTENDWPPGGPSRKWDTFGYLLWKIRKINGRSPETHIWIQNMRSIQQYSLWGNSTRCWGPPSKVQRQRGTSGSSLTFRRSRRSWKKAPFWLEGMGNQSTKVDSGRHGGSIWKIFGVTLKGCPQCGCCWASQLGGRDDQVR